MQLKQMLTTAPALALPRYGPRAGKFVLQTDASATGLGAVLYQMHGDVKRPVVYISRSLTKPERNYDTGRLETLAVVWALERLRHYVLGTQFELHSDHANLRALMRPESASHSAMAVAAAHEIIARCLADPHDG